LHHFAAHHALARLLILSALLMVRSALSLAPMLAHAAILAVVSATLSLRQSMVLCVVLGMISLILAVVHTPAGHLGKGVGPAKEQNDAGDDCDCAVHGEVSLSRCS
jgi:hypothetical protein